ncbi:MAG TPA: hypothetical protein VFY71_10975 [Planctomycetota bacterium]|nr:hypothetical protein [Planctomycetota bacterium]
MSIKLQEEYGDKLQVVFVSVGNDTPQAVQAFALAKKWLGGHAIWTSEEPFETGLGYIPAAVLLDSTGKVQIVDNPMNAHKQIVDLIDADLDQIKKGPEDAPDAVRKAWAEFGKGGWAKAISMAQALIDKPPTTDGEKVVSAAKAALESFNKAIDASLARVDLALGAGRFDRAQAELDALGKAVKGDVNLTKRVADALAKVNGDDLKVERDAAVDLAKLEKKLYENGPEKNSAKSLMAFAEKHKGTKAAERAEALADIAAVK